MSTFIRVDDRLLHGQIICAWVPYMKADVLLVASDEAAGDELVREIIFSCGQNGLKVEVERIEKAVSDINSGRFGDQRVILILGDLRDAMRVYENGMKFTSLNIGNVHHDNKRSRALSPSVIVDPEDEKIIERLEGLGVSIEIRDVPSNEPVTYVSRERTKA